MATREMLFEAGAEIAGALVPGGGLAVDWREGDRENDVTPPIALALRL